MSDFVKVVEVGARDGLQNEKAVISFEQRLKFLNLLVQAGFQSIEVGSCVSPKWVPQMDRSTDLYQSLIRYKDDLSLSLLVPNMNGFESALNVGCNEVAIFTAASETFTQKNINRSIEQSFEEFFKIIELAKQHQIKVRAYVSCVVDCPYEGAMDPAKVANLTRRLYEMGCYEISLGETIGTASPKRVGTMLQHCLQEVPSHVLAGHFHDTYGMAIANIMASLNLGIRIFDASVAGLGGCPYAKGATGNVATEDVVYLLEQTGFTSGIDVTAMLSASDYITTILKRDNQSHFAKAFKAKTLDLCV